MDITPNAIIDTIYTWYSNFTNNVTSSVSNLTVRDYIRLVWLIGGYLFLRPYLDKGFRKLMEYGVKKEGEETAFPQGGVKKTKLSANALRGEEEEEEEDGEEGTAEASGVMNWGATARRKQRKYMDYLEQEAERRKAEDDDKDIEDLLED
ncbi:hypothetical protein FQN57_001594 [Myotisia sp. PD_48]|nr:hypothetical protein FQN57_001594 [Myotisia sp. PD_48]